MRLLNGFFIAVFLTALVTACGQDGAGSPGKSSRGGGPGGFSRGPTQVVTATAQIREIREEVEAIGTTYANESVTITARVTDTISEVNFEDGASVNAGDVLVILTSEQEAALLRESMVNRDDAKRQTVRLEDLYKSNSVAESALDDARARLSAAEARYESVVASLQDRLVRAPFSGRLGFRQVSEGTLLTPGTPITTLDDLTIIKLDFSIPEVHLKLVHEGLELTARSSAFPDTEFSATVRTIDSRVDPITRAATVRAHIDNEDLTLLPGMLLTVRLTTAQRETLMVPEIALVQRASQVYVYTIKDGLAEMIQVTHAVRSKGWVEILSGLEAGDTVITEGVIKIRNGSPVTTEAFSKTSGTKTSGQPKPRASGVD